MAQPPRPSSSATRNPLLPPLSSLAHAPPPRARNRPARVAADLAWRGAGGRMGGCVGRAEAIGVVALHVGRAAGAGGGGLCVRWRWGVRGWLGVWVVLGAWALRVGGGRCGRGGAPAVAIRLSGLAYLRACASVHQRARPQPTLRAVAARCAPPRSGQLALACPARAPRRCHRARPPPIPLAARAYWPPTRAAANPPCANWPLGPTALAAPCLFGDTILLRAPFGRRGRTPEAS